MLYFQVYKGLNWYCVVLKWRANWSYKPLKSLQILFFASGVCGSSGWTHRRGNTSLPHLSSISDSSCQDSFQTPTQRTVHRTYTTTMCTRSENTSHIVLTRWRLVPCINQGWSLWEMCVVAKSNRLQWVKYSVIHRDVRVQIFILFQTFSLFTKPNFQTFNAVWMHWKAHLFRHFRLFQTFPHRFSHTPVNRIMSGL